ncbi:hypothetical protein Pmar_PMAR004308 [Perkinsus marinus ATCC 50983]|uniref:Uncharacterized protein n=1 Tax=Perkinsus marinus (strain ATCC 50983 / TXsc) TaxID=423536 RepID=C5K4F1_PERM5|nr:hypothetical protein Pmar_PMAR004308 [Perkinsus marinus ATCC 50983]EER20644.1 hypothetical protein Pmar_PMAR004308 [Perkinsus marinus ATCC 50983]|eukprot:XP_002788848.1 hypothetical protein Pmar_PMAR004308 [Perkinsus marinus ATCC 50983]
MSLVRPNELHIKGRMYEVAGRLRRGKSGDLVLQRRLMDASTPAAVLEIVLPNANKLGSVNYACALHRCAVWFRSGKPTPSGLSQVPRLALQTVRDWRAREAATITWALAVTRELEHILEFARLSMSCNEASGGDLANVVHSLTISGLNPRQCTATLAVVAKRVTAMDLSHCGVIEPKQLAAVFWGFVKLEFTDDDVMTYLVRSATTRMDEFNSQDLSMVSWALAKSLPLLPTEDCAQGIDRFTQFNTSCDEHLMGIGTMSASRTSGPSAWGQDEAVEAANVAERRQLLVEFVRPGVALS